jgi:hypothetical protein
MGGVKLEKSESQKIDKLTHAVKVIALCLPPVVMSLVGLAALSWNKAGTAVTSRRTSPGDRAER